MPEPDTIPHPDPNLAPESCSGQALAMLLRQVLARLLLGLVDAGLDWFPRIAEDVQAAQTALQTSAAQAQAWRELDQRLQDLCYELAAWVHQEIYGVPRTPGSPVPSRAEVQAYLREVHTLTQQGYALADATEEQGTHA